MHVEICSKRMKYIQKIIGHEYLFDLYYLSLSYGVIKKIKKDKQLKKDDYTFKANS